MQVRSAERPTNIPSRAALLFSALTRNVGTIAQCPQVLEDEREEEADAFVDNQMELIRSAAWEATHSFEVRPYPVAP